MKMQEWLLAKIRDCGRCGLRGTSNTLYCDHCTQEIIERVIEEKRTLGLVMKHPHRWLLTWSTEMNNYQNMVYSLKGGRHQPTFDFLAELFVAYRTCLLPRDAILAYPSKGKADHGAAWARALARVTGYSLLELPLDDPAKQARLPRHQRFFRRFRRQNLQGKSIIFVDDILTSGATAGAAFKALNRPEKFTIWTIFYRPLLSK